jgi:hypothetical protein
VDEVELALAQVVLEQIVDADLEVRVRELGHPSRVEVRRHHASVGCDAVAQPRRDRAAAGADLQAAPPRRHPTRLELTDRPRVEELLERVQPLALDRERVVEGVGLLVRRHGAAVLAGAD